MTAVQPAAAADHELDLSPRLFFNGSAAWR
jgi:hypothetical protein